MSEREAELEARLALQDDALRQLSDELWRQQREIDELRRTLEAVRRRVSTLGSEPEGGEPDPGHERPPHY